jgi:hypothetical protein
MDILSFGIIDVLKMDTSHQRPYLTIPKDKISIINID